MKKDRPAPGRGPGRPLSFDPEAALEPAMLLFWRHGFEATSLAELTRAMGVSPPSIYAAYGDKRGQFRAAVRRYLGQPHPPAELIARAPSAEAAARGMIEGAAVAFTGADTPPGCLLASSAIAVSADAEDVREEVAAIRRAIVAALRDRVAAAVAAGDMPGETDPAALAAFVMAVVQGLSTLARDGAGRAELQRVGRVAMAAWPSSEVSKPSG